MTGADGRTRPWVPFVVPPLALGAVGAALYLRDPHVQGAWGICPSAALGFDCPGCGSLRAANLLTHGDVAGAASSNLLFVVGLAGLTLWWCVALVRQLRGNPSPWRVELSPRVRRAAFWTSIAAVVAFTVARNLPGLGEWARWLAP